jgi:Fungal chitosanase of glycosyl hydrolase group 75
MAGVYQPEGLAVITLDRIPNLFSHPRTKTISTHFIGKKFMCKFPGGQLYYESKLDLDTDGSVYAAQDPSGQAATSAKDADGNSLDADLINYFVLPGGFFAAQGIRIGDIGVVIRGIRMAYACFGDVGPAHKLGEGSISLHRELGHETIIGRDTASGGRLINAGIASGVITIVFPGSGNGNGRTNEESAAIGGPLFQKLQKEANLVGDFPITGVRNIA